jgi:hypothetical protein
LVAASALFWLNLATTGAWLIAGLGLKVNIYPCHAPAVWRLCIFQSSKRLKAWLYPDRPWLSVWHTIHEESLNTLEYHKSAKFAMPGIKG